MKIKLRDDRMWKRAGLQYSEEGGTALREKFKDGGGGFL